MISWDPQQYLSFAEPRRRAGMDLLRSIELSSPSRIVDLGCGTGDLTARLAERWPAAQITGIDRSAQMLERAKSRFSGIEWELGDLRSWQPDEPVDLIYTNATLHWVQGHELLLPKLVDELAPGGALAAQVPNNFESPSHRLLRELALSPPWAARLGGQIRPWPVLSPEQYLELLSPKLRSLDVWSTTYLHLLTGTNPVLEWMYGAAIRPLLAVLSSDAERVRFKTEYGALLEEAYPPRPDGSTLFPFERIFLIAYR